jgi:hypothetical protein
MPQRERTLQVDEISHGTEQFVDFVLVEDVVAVGCLRQRGGPDVDFEQPVDDRGRVLLERCHHRGTELRAAPGVKQLGGVLLPTRPQMPFDDVRDVHDVDFDRNVFSASTGRQSSPVPTLEGVGKRTGYLAVQAHPIGQDAGRTAMRMDELGDRVAGGE